MPGLAWLATVGALTTVAAVAVAAVAVTRTTSATLFAVGRSADRGHIAARQVEVGQWRQGCGVHKVDRHGRILAVWRARCALAAFATGCAFTATIAIAAAIAAVVTAWLAIVADLVQRHVPWGR